ncbi:MAG: hypothetical protein QXS03_00155 [Candidatus Micrarchaeaceae archaeon]
MVYSLNRYKSMCIAVLFIISVVAIISAYHTSGVGWDFLSRYLNGRTLSNNFYGIQNVFANKIPINVTVQGVNKIVYVSPALTVSKNFYFDVVWEPLTSFIIAIFIILIRGAALQAYLIFLLILLLIASLVAAKKFDLDPLMLYSIFMSPFVIGTTILYNGGPILGLCLGIITVAFAVKKSYKAGIFLGLSGLAKYDSLIISPLLFLLGDKEKTLKAIILSIIVTIPWLLFNFFLFGNPLQSYLVSLNEIQPQGIGIIGLFSLLSKILWYPLILFIIATMIFVYLSHESLFSIKQINKKILKDQRSLIIISFLLLAFAGFLFVYNKAQDRLQLGYLLYAGMALVAAVTLNSKKVTSIKLKIGKLHYQSGQIIPYLIFIFSLILLLNLYAGWSHINFNVLGSLGSKDIEFINSVNALAIHNLINCSIVSNAWPYLNYYNVTTYAPYNCNSTMKHMPIVIFQNQGVQNYCNTTITNISNISQIFSYPNFSIYLPKNYICEK